MNKELLYQIFKIITIIIGLALLASFFLFNSKNRLVTRKTLIISFTLFVLLMCSLWITAVISDETIAIPVLIWIGIIIIVTGGYMGILNSSLPFVEKMLKKKRNDIDEDEK